MELVPVGFLAVHLEGILAFLGQCGIVAPQVPVTAFYSLSFLGLALTHTALGTESVVDTGSVSDDERRSVPCLGLADGLETLALVGTHSNLGYIYVAVCGLHQTQILLAHALAVGSKLCDGADGSGLRSLTAGIGVNLGVEYEYVHVLTATDNVVETAVTDVV